MEKLLEDTRFILGGASAFAGFEFANLHNEKVMFLIVIILFFVGWQIGGFFKTTYAKDKKIEGFFGWNGSYPNFKNFEITNIRFTSFQRVKNFFDKKYKKNKNFYLNNFRFSNIIKSRLNLVNKFLANRAEKKDLYYSWEALKGGKNLVIGSSGAGKSVFLTNILYQWILTNRRAVIYDIKGEFTSYFYDEKTDYIVNFDDERGTYWDFFEDIENDLEASLITEFFEILFTAAVGESKDNFWQTAAADRFKEIFKKVLYDKNMKTEDKMDVFIAKLYEYLEKVENGSDRTEQSIAATLKININLFAKNALLKKLGHKKFLITDFFKEQNAKLFLHKTQTNTREAVPFLTGFLAVLLKYQLAHFEKAGKEDYILYLIDEYLSFYKNFKKDLRDEMRDQGRSFGLIVLPALQFFNEEETKDLLANVENLFVFKLDEIETIKKINETIGKNTIKNTAKKSKVSREFNEYSSQDVYLIDNNILKTLKKGEHITYIMSYAILYKAYAKYFKIKEISQTFKRDRKIDELLFKYTKKIKEKQKIENNF